MRNLKSTLLHGPSRANTYIGYSRLIDYRGLERKAIHSFDLMIPLSHIDVRKGFKFFLQIAYCHDFLAWCNF